MQDASLPGRARLHTARVEDNLRETAPAAEQPQQAHSDVRGTHTWGQIGQTWGSRSPTQRLRRITRTEVAEGLVGGGDT